MPALTFEEIEKLGQVPILVRGMQIGLIIRWWRNTQEIGVQVPGEKEIRRVSIGQVVNLDGALATIDAMVF